MMASSAGQSPHVPSALPALLLCTKCSVRWVGSLSICFSFPSTISAQLLLHRGAPQTSASKDEPGLSPMRAGSKRKLMEGDLLVPGETIIHCQPHNPRGRCRPSHRTAAGCFPVSRLGNPGSLRSVAERSPCSCRAV